MGFVAAADCAVCAGVRLWRRGVAAAQRIGQVSVQLIGADTQIGIQPGGSAPV